ncbi:glucokinase [Telmatospirillum sp. J64-1]|uniref:glucokinase n=1 Tax=Telmatospirillum sp. J64-1 TaxID=2502183 RepID=UPI00115C9736|nr:glucokinase [Telmatospirillum sp. J64-1]
MRDDVVPGLIADIGGTNARFALAWPGGEVSDIKVFRCNEHQGPEVAAAVYLDEVKPPLRPVRAAFAVASPVTEDRVDLTNHPWSFSISGVRDHLGLDHLRVVNDFTAIALCVPHLTKKQRVRVGMAEHAVADAPIAVLGPGTGLGVSVLVPHGADWIALPTEGGHVTMPALTAREAAVIEVLSREFGHVSAERMISGPGLTNIYHALCTLENKPRKHLSPGMVSERALDETDPICMEALQIFFAMFGTVAGNMALSVGARGGVYVAGGIIPQLMTAFLASDFRARFEAKGRFQDYLAQIPVFVITHPYPAFLGLGGLVQMPAETRKA